MCTNELVSILFYPFFVGFFFVCSLFAACFQTNHCFLRFVCTFVYIFVLYLLIYIYLPSVRTFNFISIYEFVLFFAHLFYIFYSAWIQKFIYRFVFIHLQNVSSDAPLIDSSALPLEHRSVYGPPIQSPIYGAPPQLEHQVAQLEHQAQNEVSDDPWPLGAPNDSPQIKNLQVQCEKTHMRVNIEFDRPFYGMIFSKGFYSDGHCVHMKPGSGHLSATFEIFLNSCGMSSSANHNSQQYGAPTPSGSYVENTIIIQYDPYVQEVWDQVIISIYLKETFKRKKLLKLLKIFI